MHSLWFWVAVIGIVLIFLSAFGIQIGPVDFFKAGVGLSFISGLDSYVTGRARV